ncbi:MAG TPA: hypothetical protein VLI05_01955 [Candidatus Saccharimonadia bacterium]|nr:hypothetical protein [Candidatus Saccharimonadia bacterium]
MKFVLSKKLAIIGGAAAALLIAGAPALADSLTRSAQDTATQVAARAAAASDCHFFSATNSSVQRRVLTNNTPFVNTSTNWTDVACGSTSVTVPRGRSALAVVKVDAEVTCTTTNAADSQWCQGRVLINGLEGQPTAPEPDSFAWSNSQVDPNAWESNAFSRTAYLSCPANSNTTVCTFPVKVQVRNHGTGLTNRVDDATYDMSLTYF